MRKFSARWDRFATSFTRNCNNPEVPWHHTRLALCPAQSASRSDLPAFCAGRATARIRDLCNGYGNISAPGSFRVWSNSLSIPRASLPVKPCVSAVRLALPLRMALRCKRCTPDSSQARKTVPICTLSALSAKTATMPRASAIPPLRLPPRKKPPPRPVLQAEGSQRQRPFEPAACPLQRHRATIPRLRQRP